MLNWEQVRQDFPILEEKVHGRPLIYLDNAATMQMSLPVLSGVERHYRTGNGNVHRGIHTLSQRSTVAMEEARETVRRFLNAKSQREIIFTSGTTASINLVAGAFPLSQGEEVLVSQMEHHSNLVPWQEACRRTGAVLKTIPLTETGELDMDGFQALLNEKTRLVAITWVSNVLGTVNPIENICRLAHEVGVAVLVDGAQGMKLGVTDVQKMDCDFLAFSGHKLGALTGIGVLYGREEQLNQLYPVSFGGGMVDFVGETASTYDSLPGRLEAGTPNYVGAISLGAAVDYLNYLGLEEIARQEERLLSLAEAALRVIPGLHLLGAPARRTGALSFWVDGVHPFDLGALLDAQGIALRTGHHCAQPLLRRYRQESVLRLSPAFYNTEEEIHQTIAAMNRAIHILRRKTR